jgi:hypothetical protein
VSASLAFCLSSSVALAAAAAAPVDAPASPAEEEEILVLAQKLDLITLNLKRDLDGLYHCAPAQSTGLAKLDVELCEVTVKCVRKEGWDDAAVQRCVEARKPDLIAGIRGMLKERRLRERAVAQGAGA